MPNYELVALLVLSVLGPIVVALIVAAVVYHAKRGLVLAYAVGMVVLLAAITASVGFHIYAGTIHPTWWGPMIWVDIVAGIVTVGLGASATSSVLPD